MPVLATSGKDTAAGHTRHDTNTPPIRHARKTVTYPRTWPGELYHRAGQLTDVRGTAWAS